MARYVSRIKRTHRPRLSPFSTTCTCGCSASVWRLFLQARIWHRVMRLGADSGFRLGRTHFPPAFNNLFAFINCWPQCWVTFSFVSYTNQTQHHRSYFASGTGAAGLVGAFLWWEMRSLGVRTGVGLSSVCPSSSCRNLTLMRRTTFRFCPSLFR